MDFFQSQTVCPSRCYLTFFHIPERSIALVKRLAGSPKGWNWSTCPTLTKCYSKVARILIYIDGLLSVAPSQRSIALVKRLAGSPKELKLIPTCPTLTKCYSSTRILIYIDGLLSVANCAQAVAILPSSISRTFNCTSKTTGWFTKGLKLIPTCPTNKVLLKVAHAFLYTLMDFFQYKLCPSRLSYLLPFSRTFNCTSKTTGWFTKGLNLPTLTKCYSR
jgi:hypothetical protein